MEHIGLLIKRSKIRSTGNVPAYCSVKVIDSKSDTIFGNGCSKDWDIGSSGSCSLKRCGCVCKDQVCPF